MRPTEPHHLHRYLERHPEDALALQLLGRWLRRRGRNDEALDAFERSMRADPCDPFTHLYLGNLYYKDEDFDAALERFGYAEMLDPESSVPLWCQADIHEALGDQERAEAYHLRSVALNPDGSQAARYLAAWRERRRRDDDRTEYGTK